MRYAVACDHAGFPLKETVVAELKSLGNDVLDLGTDSLEAVDYP
ncbi:MAG: RpiB/LacA/LacB family sugar-phosphate isomerase, partial [Dehalococcoidia bacterium]|nr:RpiB/LacA/LacB family sugar-phosphate isomerase [Dehalococcoidia bacterium]